ncbi:laccase domain-containing protein [endosymbiont 'TC1' of Trimyema compressum]|uniref:laccase domain-containing protein n=1 Tax=endosymbiont 'TC1' of Trimyema compressum TaxID=243899 RepID=UPI003CCBC28E
MESCCYEVGENVLSKIRELNLFKPPFVENRHISLGAINEALLKRADVLNNEVSPYCTSCHNDLFFLIVRKMDRPDDLGLLY